MRIRWGSVAVAILALLALAYNRQIGAAIGALKFGHMWREFADIYWSGPAAGRFVVVCLALFLAFVTVFTLLMAWIRNKGVTLDATSVENYFNLLDQLPLKQRMDEANMQRARKYAYHFFFRRMIPLEFMKTSKIEPPYKIELVKLEDLLPAKSLGLDVICNGILHGNDFIYPAEEYPYNV